jgi:hypothetical protein
MSDTSTAPQRNKPGTFDIFTGRTDNVLVFIHQHDDMYHAAEWAGKEFTAQVLSEASGHAGARGVVAVLVVGAATAGVALSAGSAMMGPDTPRQVELGSKAVAAVIDCGFAVFEIFAAWGTGGILLVGAVTQSVACVKSTVDLVDTSLHEKPADRFMETKSGQIVSNAVDIASFFGSVPKTLEKSGVKLSEIGSRVALEAIARTVVRRPLWQKGMLVFDTLRLINTTVRTVVHVYPGGRTVEIQTTPDELQRQLHDAGVLIPPSPPLLFDPLNFLDHGPRALFDGFSMPGNDRQP